MRKFTYQQTVAAAQKIIDGDYSNPDIFLSEDEVMNGKPTITEEEINQRAWAFLQLDAEQS